MELWCSADPMLQDCRCLSLELSHTPYGLGWGPGVKQLALFHGSVVSVSSVLVGISECQFHPCFCKKAHLEVLPRSKISVWWVRVAFQKSGSITCKWMEASAIVLWKGGMQAKAARVTSCRRELGVEGAGLGCTGHEWSFSNLSY